MRRVLLLAALGLCAGLIWVAVPALSQTPYVPRAVDFELGVPGGVERTGGVRAVTATAAGSRPSPVLRAPRRFDLLGLHWRGSARVRILVRVRRDGARWTRWVPAAGADDHGPDGAPPLSASDPVWAGGADELQLRLSRPLSGLKVHFVNVTGTATPTDRVETSIRRAAHGAYALLAPADARAASSSPPGQPPIVPRSQWDPGNQCRPRVTPPQYGRVDMAFVHHTVNANSYAPADSAAIVLAICRYHRDSNGWNDIGYNFLVDRYGAIFEGRAGGVDRAVIGAQAQGYNSYSTGVSNIGDFTSVGETSAGIRSTARIIAWKLHLHGAPVQGKITETSGGGSLNAHPQGERITFNRISGHRDGDATDCPGNALYAQLPEIRSLAAGYYASLPPLGPSLSLGALPTVVSYPAPVRFSGRLSLPDGSSPAGRTIVVERRAADGTFAPVLEVTAGADGAWHASLAADSSATYRATWAGDSSYAPLSSPLAAVPVRAAVTLRAASRHVKAGRAARLAGTVAPPKGLVRVVLSRRQPNGSYLVVLSRRVRVSAGRFTYAVTLRARGLYRVSARTGTDSRNASGSSAPVSLRAVP